MGPVLIQNREEFWYLLSFSDNSGLENQQRLGDSTCWPHTTPKLAGWSFPRNDHLGLCIDISNSITKYRVIHFIEIISTNFLVETFKDLYCIAYITVSAIFKGFVLIVVTAVKFETNILNQNLGFLD